MVFSCRFVGVRVGEIVGHVGAVLFCREAKKGSESDEEEGEVRLVAGFLDSLVEEKGFADVFDLGDGAF